MRDTILTSEAVTAAHPDKLCDRISDAMVDACLMADPPLRCAAECAIASGIVFLSLRHGGRLAFDPVSLAREVLETTAPPDRQTTVMLDSLALADHGIGSDRADRMTTAFGYACDHTPGFMPVPGVAAHLLARRVAEVSAGGRLPWLAPDAQAQVAVRLRARRPVGIAGVALTLFAGEGALAEAALQEAVRAEILVPALEGLDPAIGPETRLTIRCIPGRGGPSAHSGLTGRKTSDDGYGGAARQSGSALSGKDPSRIDRVAAYAARQAALSLVAAGLAREVELQLSWVPGDAGPASLGVDSFGTGTLPDDRLAALVAGRIDLRVGAIVERLDLWSLPRQHGGQFYRDLAAYGHFGRQDLSPPWEVSLPLE